MLKSAIHAASNHSVILLLPVIMMLSVRLFSQDLNHNAGIIWNPHCMGLEYGYRFMDSLELKAMSLYVDGFGIGENDYILNATFAAVIHIRDRGGWFDPVIMAGPNYSYHHWEHSFAGTSGTIQDVTVGGGAGLGFIICERLRIGINLWINYDYITDETLVRKEKGNRFLLFIPALNVYYIF